MKISTSFYNKYDNRLELNNNLKNDYLNRLVDLLGLELLKLEKIVVLVMLYLRNVQYD